MSEEFIWEYNYVGYNRAKYAFLITDKHNCASLNIDKSFFRGKFNIIAHSYPKDNQTILGVYLDEDTSDLHRSIFVKTAREELGIINPPYKEVTFYGSSFGSGDEVIVSKKQFDDYIAHVSSIIYPVILKLDTEYKILIKDVSMSSKYIMKYLRNYE